MGQEVLVLLMLTNSQSQNIEFPDKYYNNMFVLDMLVSMRYVITNEQT